MNPGPSAPEAPIPIDYKGLRKSFLEWLKSRGLDKRYIKCVVSYLDRLLADRVIKGPMDVVRLFRPLSEGQRHNLNRAFRNLLNFLECMGWPEAYLNLLRKNIPRDEVSEDLYRPTEERILESLKLMEMRAQEKYRLLYWLILESGGLRLVEAVRLYNEIRNLEVEELSEGFCKVLLGYFRGTKRTYYAYLSQETYYAILEAPSKPLKYTTVTGCLNKVSKAIIDWKYLRKYAYDKLLELGVPESVADFIQGRVPKRIGAKHYLDLRRRADQYYPRYGQYVERLRAEALKAVAVA